MSINFFHVVLHVENSSLEKPTPIQIAYLRNSDIKRAMLPLLPVDEEGSPNPGGMLSIDEETPAFAALHDLIDDVKIDLEEFRNRLQYLHSLDYYNDWLVTYDEYKSKKDFLNVLSNTVTAIKASTDNSSITCHICWC